MSLSGHHVTQWVTIIFCIPTVLYSDLLSVARSEARIHFSVVISLWDKLPKHCTNWLIISYNNEFWSIYAQMKRKSELTKIWFFYRWTPRKLCMDVSELRGGFKEIIKKSTSSQVKFLEHILRKMTWIIWHSSDILESGQSNDIQSHGSNEVL